MTAAGALWRARDGRTVHYVSGRTAKAVRSWADADAKALDGPSQREEQTIHGASAATPESRARIKRAEAERRTTDRTSRGAARHRESGRTQLRKRRGKQVEIE